jgi:hypothetical protein
MMEVIWAVVGLIAGWRAMRMAWDKRLRSIATAATFICGFVLVQPVIISFTQALRR